MPTPLLRYLSEDQVVRISKDLAGALDHEENVHSLVELLESLNEDAQSFVSASLVKFITTSIQESKDLELLRPTVELLSKLPTTTESVINWVSSSIVSIIEERLAYLVAPAFVPFVEKSFTRLNRNIDWSNSDISLEYLASYVEILVSLESCLQSEELDILLLTLLTTKEERVSDIASSSLRWRDLSPRNVQELSWEIIPLLLNSENEYHVTNGFILWLRFLMNLQKTGNTSDILDLKIGLSEYWKLIQTGLMSAVHEHRKYALSILNISIQINHIDLDNEYITFNQAISAEQVESWKRFSTLFEIMGVDTSINQAEAARNDIVKLLSPSSYIKPSWGLALLSTGFKGSMESIKKFALEIMFSVPEENLSIFGSDFLASVFLYVVEASHFQVHQKKGKTICAYGERLELFISQVLGSLKADKDALEEMSLKILSLLVELRSTFPPSRVYLSSGLLKGLKGLQVFSRDQTKSFLQLFESTAEDELFETYLQTTNLLLLKHIKSDVQLVFDLIVRFVQINGYALFNSNIEIFLDYISVYHDKSEIKIANEPEYQVIEYALFETEYSSDEFLKELAFSQIDFSSRLSTKFSELLTSLLEVHSTNYSRAHCLVDLDIFKNSWRSVNLQKLYYSVLNDEFDLDKLKLFTRAFAKVTNAGDGGNFVELSSILKLDEKLRSMEKDFKTKDLITAEFQSFLLSFLKIYPVNDDELSIILTLLRDQLAFGFHHGYTGICMTLQFLLSNYAVDIIEVVEILELIWDQITSDRLVLNQKDMHITFIETLYHEVLLKDTINNEYNGKVILNIGTQIVSLSFSRRSLLPSLTKKLLHYSLGYKCEFEQTEWIHELMLRVLCLIQDDSTIFKIKDTIASKYDDEISFDGNLYRKIYGDEEISAKVNIISILASSSQRFSTSYINKLLVGDPYNILVPKKKTDGAEEFQRILAFGSILLVSKRIPKDTLSELVSSTLMKCLQNEPSPLVRCYLEWILSIDLIQSDSNRDLLFEYFQDQNRPSLVLSVERVAMLTVTHLNGASALKFMTDFTKQLISNCASNKPLIRHFSNSLILSVYPLLQSKNLDLPFADVLETLFKEAKKTETLGKFRSGDALIWDAEGDFNLVSIFGGVLTRISPRVVTMIPKKSFSRYIKGDTGVEIGDVNGSGWNNIDDSSDEGVSAKDITGSSPLQTKSGAWETVLDLDEKSRAVKRSELIVVSSLVDKPPNLGGICRLCDVLGAGLMTVDDLRVKSHPQFKNVAVTADHWMPMAEVKIEDIAEFMRGKKKEGYTLIGLEQTDKSIVLGKETNFPVKSLILLGKEAEGIPGPLLSELDYCVEIRQQGVIRSMNIQTATAVIVHAYASSQT